MDNIIVYIDDMEFARHQLVPMESQSAGDRQPTHWIVVACPPRLTRHISKWVNHAARENWRSKWAEEVFSQVSVELTARGDTVTPVLARGPLAEMTKKLQAQHGNCRVLDARRPKFGHDLPPVTSDQPATNESRWSVPGAVAGLGAVLVLASE
ncbi:MAG: hypothetical protein ACO24Y_10450 [Hylemonella sp.]